MKAKKKMVLLIAVVGWLIFSQQSTLAVEADSQEGNTSLVIVPIDEKLPRLYETTDLKFGEKLVTDTKTKHPSTTDLSIQLLDSMRQPISWELQVKISTFTNETQQALKAAELAIGKGSFVNSKIDKQVVAYPVSRLTDTYQPIIQATGKKDYGWITYTIPKEQITLSYGNENLAGSYTAIISWQVVNADL